MAPGDLITLITLLGSLPERVPGVLTEAERALIETCADALGASLDVVEAVLTLRTNGVATSAILHALEQLLVDAGASQVAKEFPNG